MDLGKKVREFLSQPRITNQTFRVPGVGQGFNNVRPTPIQQAYRPQLNVKPVVNAFKQNPQLKAIQQVPRLQTQIGQQFQRVNIPKPTEAPKFVGTGIPFAPVLPGGVVNKIANFEIGQFNAQVPSLGRSMERAGQGKFASKGNRSEDIGNAMNFMPAIGGTSYGGKIALGALARQEGKLGTTLRTISPALKGIGREGFFEIPIMDRTTGKVVKRLNFKNLSDATKSMERLVVGDNQIAMGPREMTRQVDPILGMQSSDFSKGRKAVKGAEAGLYDTEIQLKKLVEAPGIGEGTKPNPLKGTYQYQNVDINRVGLGASPDSKESIASAIKAIKEGKKLPPVTVKAEVSKTGYMGQPEINYTIIDGNHRLAAYQQMGVKDIPVLVKQSDKGSKILNADEFFNPRVAQQPLTDAKTVQIKDIAKKIDQEMNGGINNRMDMRSRPQVDSSKVSTLLPEKPQQLSDNPSATSLQDASLPDSIAQIPNSEQPYFNTNKYNIPAESKQQVNRVIQEIRPQIEEAVGKKLSNDEIIDQAKRSSEILNKVVSREQTADFEARLLKTRQALAASEKVDQAYIENLMAIKSHSSDIARKLQSFSIGADPSLVTSRDAILEAVLKVEQDSAKVIKAAEGVDFNDLRQATNFYRTFIKPTKREWLDLIRYNSMLSSPVTHIVNTFSNAVNSGVVAPIEKTMTGTIDFLGSAITGKKQQQFAAEGAVYAKGYFENLGKASQAFADSMRGKTITSNLDVRQIPLATKGAVNNLNIPTRLLEASDQFFTALTRGGEEAALTYRKAKGGKVGNIETQALENAKYRVFRSELHSDRQGTVLNAIDDFTGLIQKARSSENPITSLIANFTLPFVQTPMNIVKQGVEYSPLGFTTLKGAANKPEQLSKAILGSAGMAATVMLIASGRSTWAEPQGADKKAAFRAAGLQPYSIKIGDKWVSYAKLPPALGFPIAFAAALHDAKQNKTLDQNEIDMILTATAKMGNFYADQSYLKNIGNLVAAAKGSPEAMAQFVSNYPQQIIPYRALLGWMARITDPYQRKVDTDANFFEKQVQTLFTQIPGLSMTVPARVDKNGDPIPNQYPIYNNFSPVRISKENPEKKQIYDLKQQESLLNKNVKIIKQKVEKGEDVTGLMEASADNSNQDEMKKQMQLKAQEDVAKAKVKLNNSAITVGDKIIYGQNGEQKSIDLTPPTPGTGIDAFTNENWNLSKAREVYKAQISQDQKDAAYKKLGVDPKDVRYDYLASHNEDVSTKYILSKSPDHQALLKNLISGRTVSVSGQQFASDGVLKKLLDEGHISGSEYGNLKKIKTDKAGKSLNKVKVGRGRKAKKVKMAKFPSSLPKSTLKIKKSKALKVKLGKSTSTPKKVKVKGLDSYESDLKQIARSTGARV